MIKVEKIMAFINKRSSDISIEYYMNGNYYIDQLRNFEINYELLMKEKSKGIMVFGT